MGILIRFSSCERHNQSVNASLIDSVFGHDSRGTLTQYFLRLLKHFRLDFLIQNRVIPIK